MTQEKDRQAALEKELRELHGVILRVSVEGCERIERHEPVSEINSAVDFLRSLWSRRDMILHELKKLGVSEREALLSGKEAAD